MTLEVSAPIIPLLPDEHHCPTGYSLPKRKRNKDALDIPKLATTFSVSLVYEEKSYIDITEKSCSSIENPQATENDNKIIFCDLAVLGVLSPYTLLPHVIIMEISKDRYLPGPESFSDIEWLKISDLAKRVVITMKKKQTKNSKNSQLTELYLMQSNAVASIGRLLRGENLKKKCHVNQLSPKFT